MINKPFAEEDLLLSYPYSQKNPVFIDVGAGVGDTSLPYAKLGWQIIAFEPEKENYLAARSTLKLFPKVKVVQKAVSNVDGKKVNFYVSQYHVGIHSLIPFHKSHRLSYQVNTVRLDKYLVKEKVKKITLLKIDVEGADFLALKSFDFQKLHPEIVMTEFMDSRSQKYYGYGFIDVIKYLEKYDYVAYVSEWEKIEEYGRKDRETKPHKWIKCVKFDKFDGNPYWGNLIFVSKNSVLKFDITLKRYLLSLRLQSLFSWAPDIGYYLNTLIVATKRIFHVNK